MSPFLSRILVTVVLLPVVLGIVWAGGWWLFTLALVGGLLALHELYGMARGLHPMVLGGYAVQTHQLSWEPVWLSLPVAFLVAAILQANDARDIADDRASGITTASTLLGPVGARGLLSSLLLAPYIIVLILVATLVASWPVAATWLSLPLA